VLSGGRWSVIGGRLVDGANALLVPPGDAAVLASAIEQLSGDAEMRARLAAGGRALAEQFAWPAIARQHEHLYAQLLGATTPGVTSSR